MSLPALGDAHASVRVAALRNADPLLWSGTAPQLRAASSGCGWIPIHVSRCQLLATLGEIGTDAQVRETMVHVLTHDCESKAMRTVALSSLGGAEAALLGRLLGDPNWREALPGRAEFLRDLSQRTVSTWVDTARGDDDGRSALHMFAKRIDAMPETGELAWHKAAVLEGIDRATQQPAVFGPCRAYRPLTMPICSRPSPLTPHTRSPSCSKFGRGVCQAARDVVQTNENAAARTQATAFPTTRLADHAARRPVTP